jgi:DNA-binding NtrC family response regulator
MATTLPKTPPTVLIVDDEPKWAARVREKLPNYALHYCASPEEGLAFIQEHPRVLAVLLDIFFGEHPRGLDAVTEFSRLGVPVIMLSAYEKAELIETAIKRGAETFVPKDKLNTLPERLESYIRAQEHPLTEPFEFLSSLGIEARSPQMRELAQKIRRIAPTNLSVLILGETGTGKTLFARAIHMASHLSAGPFVRVDIPNVAGSSELFSARLFGCVPGAYTGAPPKPTTGFFHEANGGTLFLDEIGDLSWEQQSKLLIPIEEKRFTRVGSTREETVDIRIISATNHPLASMVDQGRFRRDLYERLCEETIEIPPLRERPEDIRHLARHFARTLPSEIWKKEPPQTPFGFPEASLDELCSYHWPGNVRELERVVSRCLLIAYEEKTDSITPRIVRRALQEHAPSSSSQGKGNGPLDEIIGQTTREAIERALSKHNGNVTKAARELGKSREHIYRLCREHGIDPNRYRNKAPKSNGDEN